ncbi:hypothetical protein HQ585_09965 [candidate division KSB1 bacterium]|nr:hypothetical protein [candidate division KSB1 bacterium]
MNIKKLVLSTFVVGFTMWVISGLWHNLILANFYASEIEASHDGIGILLIAYLILGLFMAYMFPLGYNGGRPAIEGLRFGALIGLLWVFPHELAMVGAHGESLSYVLKNAAWHAVEQGLGGIVVGLIYGHQDQ